MGQVIYLHRLRGLRRARAANRGSLIAGAWLLFAAVALDFEGVGVARWNQALVGAAILILAGARVSHSRDLESVSWMIAFLGLWLVGSPFVLSYSTAAQPTVNSILVGLAVLGLGSYSAHQANQALRGHSRPDARSSDRHAS